jgi:hypothetical protein
MTPYVTATLAAAHNDELHRRGAHPLPLWALDAIRSSDRPSTIKRYFLRKTSQARVQPVRRRGVNPRAA